MMENMKPERKKQLELPPITPLVKIPLVPTPDLVSDAELRLELLKLFDLWDINNDYALSCSEIIQGLYLAGIKCNAKQLAKSIYDISLLSGDVASEDMKTLKNHEFVSLMLLPEYLGSHSTESQFQAINIMREGLKDEQTRIRLKKKIDEAALKYKNSPSKRIFDSQKSDIVADAHSLRIELNDPHNREKSKFMCVIQMYDRNKLFLWFCVWWLTGTLFYVYLDEWNFIQGLYYSIQAGFSIGFGSLSEEKKHGMNAFEKCISYKNSFPNVTSLFQNVLHYLNSTNIEHSTEKHVLCAYQYIENPYTISSMLYTVLHICLGAILIGGVLSYFSASAIDKVWYDEDRDKEQLEQVIKQYQNKGIKGKLCIQFFHLKNWIGDHPTSIVSWSLLCIWIVLGAVIFEILEEENGKIFGTEPFIKGLYFALSAASTGGLAGPSPSNESSMLFTCIFCTFAVPLYAYSLGEIANVFTGAYVKKKDQDRREREFDEMELKFMDRLGDGDGRIDECEFAVLWFLRNGMITPDDVIEMKKDFRDLDADGNGIFSKSEMQVSAFFQKYAKQQQGQISSDDLENIASELQKLKSVEYPGKFLLDPAMTYGKEKIIRDMIKYDEERETVKIRARSKSGNAERRMTTAEVIGLNRREFMKWWVEDFLIYVNDSPKNILANSSVNIQILLDAIEGRDDGNENETETKV
jgi:Ca2+-binding EF-hand superfamily protein